MFSVRIVVLFYFLLKKKKSPKSWFGFRIFLFGMGTIIAINLWLILQNPLGHCVFNAIY